MKKIDLLKKATALIISATFFCVALTGCGNSSESAAASDTAPASEASTITITFMNNDTLLGTATGNAGEVLDPSSYSSYESVDGYEFSGWYETPTLLAASQKDLSTATFAEDTTLYGDFLVSSVTLRFLKSP